MYSNSKIYKITDVGCNECYYGSTVQPLSKRIGQHRSHYSLYKKGKASFVTSFILFDKVGLENCKIELVETFECKSKEELHQREAYYIRNNECVNKVNPGRIHKEYQKEYQKEYREENQDKLKEYQKEYYEENKENIKEQQKEYREENKEKLKERYKEYGSQRVTCDICNKEMRKDSLTKHKKLHKSE